MAVRMSKVTAREMQQSEEEGEAAQSQQDGELQQRQSMLDSIKDDLLGAEPNSKLKTIFYRVDPFQGEQMIRAPKHFHAANIYFGFLYWGLIVLFAVGAFYQFFTRPVIESYVMIPSYKAPVIPINVSLYCDPNGSACATCNGSWVQPEWGCNGTLSAPYIQESYVSTHEGYCEGIASDTSLHPTSLDSPTHLNLTACYSTNFDDGILISVPFSAGYAEDNPPRMIITLTSAISPDLFYEQQLEPAQRKSVFLGQTNYYSDVDDTEYTQTYVSDLFYDGKNGNSNGELRIKVAQLSTISEKTKPGTVFDVFASVGGFATVLFPVATFLKDMFLTVSQGGCFSSFSENTAKIFMS